MKSEAKATEYKGEEPHEDAVGNTNAVEEKVDTKKDKDGESSTTKIDETKDTIENTKENGNQTSSQYDSGRVNLAGKKRKASSDSDSPSVEKKQKLSIKGKQFSLFLRNVYF